MGLTVEQLAQEKLKLELYKRALDLAKQTFQISEAAIKTIEEKGRNNVTIAPAVLGFAVLVLRPDTVAAKFSWVFGWQMLALLSFAGAVVSVILVYQTYLTITQPSQADQVDPQWIADLPEQVGTELDSVASELGVFQVYIAQSQAATKSKSRALKRQTTAMLIAVGLVGLYLLLAAMHIGLTPTAASS